jgi:hypothetical protein
MIILNGLGDAWDNTQVPGAASTASGVGDDIAGMFRSFFQAVGQGGSTSLPPPAETPQVVLPPLPSTSSVNPQPPGTQVTVYAAPSHWYTSKLGILAILGVLGAVGYYFYTKPKKAAV